MKMILEQDSLRVESEVSRKDALIKAAVGESACEWRLLKADGPRFIFETDSGVVQAYAIRQKDELFLHLDGRSWRLKDVSEESGRTDAGQSGDLRVVAPMPGTVIKVLVGEGDVVKRGQPLVIVEAMKMENEVRAASDAEVCRVLVQAGEKVGFGQQLVELVALQEADGASASH